MSTLLHLGAALAISATDGAQASPVFAAEALAWGVAVAANAGLLFTAVGDMFAPGEASVDIWSMQLDGSEAVNLTAAIEANDALPHPSPDGRRLAFRSGGDHGGSVYVMDADGGGRRRLTGSSWLETQPAFSPDGEWVVFTTTRAVGWKLWLQQTDGPDGRWLEPDRLDIPDVSMHPRFSPDGRWIVFTSDRAGLNDEWPLAWSPSPTASCGPRRWRAAGGAADARQVGGRAV